MIDENSIKIFSSRDMVRQQLIEYAEDYLDLRNIDMTNQSYLSYLINVISVLTSNLIFYNNATYREFFLIRAMQKESVLNIAAMVGYKPEFASYATAKVLIAMPIYFKSNTTITMHGRGESGIDPFMFYSNEVPFSCRNKIVIDIIMSEGLFLSANIRAIDNLSGGVSNVNWKINNKKDEIYFYVDVDQVKEEVTTFKFPGLNPYQFYNYFIPITGDIAHLNVETFNLTKYEDTLIRGAIQERRGYEVFELTPSDRDVWTAKESLFLIDHDENAFTYRINENGIKLFFGNGVIGSQPKSGVTCIVTTGITLGYNGNVISGSINKCDTLYAAVIDKERSMKLPVKLTCTNPSPAFGGRTFATIDEIRQATITSVLTNKRLVSKLDYDNAKNIIPDLPIKNAIPILKRSDLKRNEICLFTDLVFMNEYVPTKNIVARIHTGYENVPIRFGDPLNIDIIDKYNIARDFQELDDYVSLFDISIDTNKREADYYYVLDTIEKDFITSNYNFNHSKQRISPYNIKLDVTKDYSELKDDTLTVKIYYRTYGGYVPSMGNGYKLKCYLEIDNNDVFNEMESSEDIDEDHKDEGDENLNFFQYTVRLVNIPQDEIKFSFQFGDEFFVDNNEIAQQNERNTVIYGYCKSVVKKNLKEFMYSKVRTYNNPSTIYEEDYILINSVSDLQKIGNVITHPLDANYRLMTDISLHDVGNWTPIGINESTPFSGIFDGGEHTISNITMEPSVNPYYGLFGICTSSARILDLNVKNVNIEGVNNVGAIVGLNNGRITNCNIIDSGELESSNISGIKNIGGIAGSNYGEIFRCSCSSNCTIEGYNQIGGITGSSIRVDMEEEAVVEHFIKNCFSKATIIAKDTASYIGGIVGFAFNINMDLCYTSGLIKGLNYIGGLVGSVNWVSPGTEFLGRSSISNCYSIASLQFNSDDPSSVWSYIGGLIGFLRGKELDEDMPLLQFRLQRTLIEKCYFSGTVVDLADDLSRCNINTIHGICGVTLNSYIVSCFWDMTLLSSLEPDDYSKTTVQMKSLETYLYGTIENKWSLDYWFLREDYLPELKIYSLWGLIYDIPVIRKDYLEYLDTNNLRTIFYEEILHKISVFDITSYKMLTDFVNIKFSNTCGLITNMNFNEDSGIIINLIDPLTIPNCVGTGFTCAITNDLNAWNASPYYQKRGGFLATFDSEVEGQWKFSRLSTNDIVLFHKIEPDQYGYYNYYSIRFLGISEYNLDKLIFNGDNFFKLTKYMPLQVRLDIWKDDSANISDNALINNIKDAIERNFIPKYGYDKPIYHSDLTRIVQGVVGVSYCTVLDPPHDIFFNYNLDNFDHETILRYTPELIYISSEGIEINIKS